ncbi:TPA: hypothetical protein K8M95_002838 [Clostridium perfringens]|uniref:hypothetical protein n=1 Tax=Clostridium perfringens TaxID=1502 RepID=UPI0011572805|nr:hypothetical protein [Clostridium perfringens]ELC8390761.1 hypothetical protein [Clostridium perfringens]MDH5095244.1 hypothetical protein [Clostridium perfringens]MDK0631109.1 hypothetical protein [Clostridium perfringens]MDU2781336.1 hypothetical protein [Clostridium perfringens]MDU3775535.1 hypothetical protein [Clostridium perfringens]
MDIKKYQFEIMHIIDELKSLEDGCFYEEGCQAHPGSASAKTIAKNVREEFIDLIKKIKEDEPGIF